MMREERGMADRGFLVRESARMEKKDERTYRLSFSSEEPYGRWFGDEILSHAEGAVNLDRLNSIGTVLFNHDRDMVIGRIDRAWVEDGRGMCEITLDDDELSERVRAKIESGSLKGVSVGYIVDEWEDVPAGKKSDDGRHNGPCSIATRWTPLEVSVVSVPADATVGVGRSEGGLVDRLCAALLRGGGIPVKGACEQEEVRMNEKEERQGAIEAAQAKNAEAEVRAAVKAEEVNLDKVRASERARIVEIDSMCRHFGMESADYINSGVSVEAARAAIMEKLMESAAPIPAKGSLDVMKDEGDKFRDAATEGLMMRSGVKVDKPIEGARGFRGMSLRDLAIECLTREGESGLIRKSSDELFEMVTRQFYNPSAAFPAIMDQTIRKSIVELYNHVPTTFQLFTTKGSLPDFKETADHEYVIGGVGDFLKVPENGEIKADLPRTELLPQRKLETYAKQFSMTRQAFVNDDIGFLTRVPGLYATAAKKTIDKQVYAILFNNATIFDGTALFTAAHKNLIGTGSKPTQASIQEAILKLQGQTDQFGDAIYMTPRRMVVPVGYEFDLAVIFRSAQVVGSGNNDINPLYNYPLEIVQSPVLNAMAGSSACPWFLFADESSARGIQVDYLNGQETPTVRRMETPGTLGFTWDIWLDWGISVRDFRGIVRNPGVVL